MYELDDKEIDDSRSHLDIPEFLILKGVNSAGPFNSVNEWFCKVKPIQFTCSHIENEILDLTICSLWKDKNGSHSGAKLVLDRLSKDYYFSLNYQLSLQGALTPGLYHSQLKITDAENTASIPVSVRISAHWLWMLIFLLLGLISFGIGQYLAGEQAIQEKRKEILELRQAFFEFKDQNQAAYATHTLTSNIEELFSTALRFLGDSRPIGLKDTRIERAEYYKTAAVDADQEVRRRLSGKTPGDTELSSLNTLWSDLLKRSQAIEKLLHINGENPQKSSPAIPALALQLEKKLVGQIILPSLKAIRDNLSVQVESARLIYSTGQIERAKQFSGIVETWLQRAAAQLEKDFKLILTWRETFRSFILLELQVRTALNGPELSNETSLNQQYNNAVGIIERQPDLIGIRDANQLMGATLTGILRRQSDKLIAEIQNAINQIKVITSLDSIDQIFATAPKDNSPVIKQQTLLKVLAKWDYITAGFIMPEIRKSAQLKTEKIRQLILEHDFISAEKPMSELINYWEQDYNARVTNAMDRLIAPYCMNMKLNLERTLIATDITAKQLQPNPEVAGVDEVLDRLMLKAQKVPSGIACLDYLLELDDQANAISNKVFNIGLMVVEIRAEDKVAAAKRSGLDAAVRLTERFMREPWPVAVKPRTLLEEHYVDRILLIAIDNLKQSWGAGTLIKIDFGDESPLLYKTAEKVREAGVISHRYSQSGNYTMQVTALTDKESHKILGVGSLTLAIDPSPISKAGHIAGMFFNMRFLLSLVIALMIQVWKLHREAPFGGKGSDYIEAFAIGVGSNAGMEGVTALLKTVSG